MDDYTEIEKKLKQAADKIEIDDFSVRLKQIEKELELEKNKEDKKKFDFRKIPTNFSSGSCTNAAVIAKKRFNIKIVLLISVIVLAIAAAVILPVVLLNLPDIISFFDENELSAEFIDEIQFYAGLDDANIVPIDFSDFYTENFRLLVNEDFLVKGGMLDMYDDEDNSTLFATITFFDATVSIDATTYANFDLSYEKSNVSAKYKLIDYTLIEGFEGFDYGAVVWHNSMFYRIAYFSIYDNITEFFDSTFN